MNRSGLCDNLAMNSETLFGMALGLHTPWQVKDCALPRITTTDGKVHTVDVPWARPGSGFALLFEALALALIERDSQSYEVEMPVNRVAEILKVNPQRIGRSSSTGLARRKRPMIRAR